MGKSISSLAVILSLSAGPFVGGVKTAQGATSSLIDSLAKLSGVTLAVEAASALAAKALELPGEAYSAAKRQSDAQSKLEAVLRATGYAAGFSADQIEQNAASLSKSTTYSKTSIEEFQGVLATFRNVSGDAFTQATSLAADMNSVMGGDLSSTAVQLGKALNDPIEGITALKRVGVSFTQTQIAQIKAMQDAGNVAGAQAVVLAELRSEFGGTAEAMAKTPFGRLAQTGNLVEEAMAAAGKSIAVVGSKLVSAFRVNDLLDSVTAGLDRVSVVIGTALDAAQPYIETFVSGATATFWMIVGGVETAFAAVYGVVAPVIEGVYSYLSARWSAIVAVTESILGSAWSAVSGVFIAIYSYVAEIVGDVYAVIAANWSSIVDTTVDYYSAVYGFISSVLTAAWDIVSGVAQGLANLWRVCWSAMGFDVLSTGDTVTAVTTGIGGALKWLEQLVSGTLTLASFAISNFGLIVEGILVGSAYQIVKFCNQVAYAFTGIIGPVLLWIGQNWQAIFTDMMNVQQAVLGNLLKNAANFGSAIWSALKGDGFSFNWTPLTEGFHSALTTLPQIADREVGHLEKSLGDQSKTLGDTLYKNLGQTFLDQENRSKAASGAIKDQMHGLADSIKNAFNKPPEIKTPKTPEIKPPQLITPKQDVDTSPAEKKIKKLKEHADDWHAVVAGSAEAMQAAAEARIDAALGLSDNGGSGKAIATQQTVDANLAEQAQKTAALAGVPAAAPVAANAPAAPVVQPVAAAPLPDRAIDQTRGETADKWELLLAQLKAMFEKLTTSDKSLADIAGTSDEATFSI